MFPSYLYRHLSLSSSFSPSLVAPLAFVVSSRHRSCTPSGNGVYLRIRSFRLPSHSERAGRPKQRARREPLNQQQYLFVHPSGRETEKKGNHFLHVPAFFFLSSFLSSFSIRRRQPQHDKGNKKPTKTLSQRRRKQLRASLSRMQQHSSIQAALQAPPSSFSAPGGFATGAVTTSVGGGQPQQQQVHSFSFAPPPQSQRPHPSNHAPPQQQPQQRPQQVPPGGSSYFSPFQAAAVSAAPPAASSIGPHGSGAPQRQPPLTGPTSGMMLGHSNGGIMRVSSGGVPQSNGVMGGGGFPTDSMQSSMAMMMMAAPSGQTGLPLPQHCAAAAAMAVGPGGGSPGTGAASSSSYIPHMATHLGNGGGGMWGSNGGDGCSMAWMDFPEPL